MAGCECDGRPADTGCNVRLKGLKTLSDRQRKLVNLHPKNTTIAAINALPQPHATPKTRSTDFSRRVWRVPAQIIEFKTRQLDEFNAKLDAWMDKSDGHRIPHRAVVQRDRDTDYVYLLRVEFESYDIGMENSSRPETGEFAAFLGNAIAATAGSEHDGRRLELLLTTVGAPSR